MMMPANFSAISENEMTYVVGGALVDVLAPVLEEKNWKIFNTNMVTLIGNHYVNNYVSNTLGVIFSGSYTPGQVIGGWKSRMGEISTVDGVDAAMGAQTAAYLYTGLNVALNIVGNAAAIYNLASKAVDIKNPTNF